MPTFKSVPGPPQLGLAGEGRTETSGIGPKCAKIAPVSTDVPAAMARTVAVGRATVLGTGKSSRIKRCKHLARQP